MSSTGKILRSAATVLAVLLALLVLFVVLVPRIVNVDAVRTAIERTVSLELGGTVTFGRVGLSLVPHPKIVIRDAAVEVPGSVSATVAGIWVSARILPLLRGRFAVESVTLDRPALVFTAPGQAADGGKPPSPGAKPAKRSLGEVLTVLSRAMPGLPLAISGGSLSLVRAGRSVLSLGELEGRLVFVPVQAPGEGPVGGPSDVSFHITGDVQGTISQSKSLPGPIRMATGRFDAVPERLAIVGSRARLLDMDVTLDGSIGDYLSTAPKADITASGSIGPDSAAWLGTLAGLPDDVKLRAPLGLTNARLRTSRAGAAPSRELSGSIVVKDGLTIPFDLRQEPGLLSLQSLRVKDGASDALLSVVAAEEGFEIAFAGSLEGSTLLRILDRERLPFRSIKGDLRVQAPRGRWREATAKGALEGRGLVLAAQPVGVLVLERLTVRADGRAVRLAAPTVALDRYVAADVALMLSTGERGTTVNLERASVCGIAFAGRLRVDDREIEVALQPHARGRSLEEDFRCLFPGDLLATGTYDLSGSLAARGRRDSLLRSLQGTFDLSAKKGSVSHDRVVEGVIAYLEKTSVLKSAQAARLRERVPYETITIRGALREGVLDLTKVAVKSKVMQAAAEGRVDLRGRTLGLQVLVAPLTGIDQVLSKVPVVRHIAGSALVVVPVRIEGSFEKPEVRHLPASGVGASVANLMKNIVQAPVNIIEPLAPAAGGKSPE